MRMIRIKNPAYSWIGWVFVSALSLSNVSWESYLRRRGIARDSNTRRRSYLVWAPPHGCNVLVAQRSGVQFTTHTKQFVCSPTKQNPPNGGFFCARTELVECAAGVNRTPDASLFRAALYH